MSWHQQNTNIYRKCAWILISLTLLLMMAQVAFFFVHYKVADIVDSLVDTSIFHQIFHAVILLPIMGFIFIQIVIYGLFIAWLWFLTVSLTELFSLSFKAAYGLCLSIGVLGWGMVFLLNAYYFPTSFFAEPLDHSASLTSFLVISVLLFITIVTVLAYVNCFWFKCHRALGMGFIFSFLLVMGANFDFCETKNKSITSKPNIILIGLDSLRPDYIGYFNHAKNHTPILNYFLQNAIIFTNAYSPLGRTFPAWVSILTGKYPLHHHARMNLADPLHIIKNDNLAHALKNQGYFTLYGTDEVRFTDITFDYGFDRIIGPKGGAVEFLLAGLSDFPLTNLFINLPVGKWIFPYNYGNRAADITYQPDAFLQLVKDGLKHRPEKPVFLAVHLCLSHWPFRWAQDGQSPDLSVPERYRESVQAIDKQLEKLLAVLQHEKLLDHAIVVLLSDHGVTLGMPGDRLIAKQNYRGNLQKMKLVNAYKLEAAPDFTLDIKRYYSINTSYGQGTDVLSLKQNHVLLAMRGFGVSLPKKKINEFSSLLDIAPTILDSLHYPSLLNSDGVSKWSAIHHAKSNKSAPFFIETGDKVTEIESNKIFVEQVVKKTIAAYHLDPRQGFLILAPEAEQSIIRNKQRAIIWKDWLLARYPAEMRYKKVASTIKNQFILKPVLVPAYFVLVNLKTKQWTVDLASSFSKKAPVKELMSRFNTFYQADTTPASQNKDVIPLPNPP